MKPERVSVNVKLHPGVNREAAVKRLSIAPGVDDVIQTFPGENDEELASLYLFKVKRSRVDEALAWLRHDKAVDYVEPAAPRKLIRSS